MKTIYTLLIGFLTCFSLSAQPPTNATVFDCNGVSKNIYQTLATGKAVIVLHKGVDCSICRNAASGWQTWAAANSTNVEVWGAITYTYNAASFQPMCQKTLNWKNTYNWSSIFTFADSNRQWIGPGSPQYHVYSAIDSSIVYSGGNPTTARNIALMQSTVGLQNILLEGSNIYYNNGSIRMENLNQNITELDVYSVNGKLVKHLSIQDSDGSFSVSDLKKGIYLLNFKTSENQFSTKKISIL